MKTLTRLISVLLLIPILMTAGCSKASRKARLLARADQHFKTEQYDKAEIEYLAVLRGFPLEPTSIRQLGLLYSAEGRIGKAFPFLNKALQQAPDNLEVRAKLALAYGAARQPKEAREHALWVLGKQPSNADAVLLLGTLAANSNEVQQTRQLITNLQQRASDQAVYHVALAWLAHKEQNRLEAEAQAQTALSLNPTSAVAHRALGMFRLMAKDTTNAGPELKRAAELAPLRSGDWLRYAEFQLQSGAPDEARKTLEQLTKKAPDYIPAWTTLIQLLSARGRLDECSGVVAKLLMREPDNLDALLIQGQLLLAKRNGTNAVTHFQRMTAAYDQVPEVHYWLARAQLLNNNLTEAMGSLNRAIVLRTNYTDAVLLYTELNSRKGNAAPALNLLPPLVKLYPRLPQAQLLLATAYLIRKQPDQALTVYEQMAGLFPKSPEPLLLEGTVLASQNRFGDAAKALERAITISTNYLPALVQLVNLDLAQKQYASAMDRVRKQIETNPTNAVPQLLLARVYLAQGQTNQAESALLKSLELNPDIGETYHLLARIYVVSGKYAQALEKLEQRLAKTNDAVALLLTALIQEELKDFPAARDSYEKLLKISPANTLALNNLANLYSERFGQLDRANALAEKAKELRPDDPVLLDTLGWVLYRKGNYAGALPLLQDSATKLPTDPEIQFHMAMTHYALDEEAPARVALQTALAAKKDFPGIEEAKRKLALLSGSSESADPKQIADLETQARQNPDDPVILTRLAGVYEREGAADKAAKAYEAVLKKNPRNAQVMGKLALLYAGPLNDQKKSLDLAKEAHRIAPGDARISQLLGRLVYATGDYNWAFSLLTESTPNLPADPTVLYDLALSQYSMGKVALAEATMRSALKLGAAFKEKADAEQFMTLLAAANNADAARKAAPQIEKALAAGAQDVPALMAAACVARDQGKDKEAAGFYEAALKIFPEFSPAARQLAFLYAERLGQDERAYSLAMKARNADPEDAEIAKVLGILSFRKADYPAAIRLLKDSARKRSGDGEVFFYLGMAHRGLKQRTEAKEALQRAVALDGQAKFVAEAKRELGELK